VISGIPWITTKAEVNGNKPPYKLHHIIDDPDLGEFVQFEKQR